MLTQPPLEMVKGREHSENLSIDGKEIVKCILKKHCVTVDWIYLAHHLVLWRVVVNTKLNLRLFVYCYSTALFQLRRLYSVG
jgi:hypothetical protein